jgi:hypothetical protein
MLFRVSASGWRLVLLPREILGKNLPVLVRDQATPLTSHSIPTQVIGFEHSLTFSVIIKTQEQLFWPAASHSTCSVPLRLV